MAYNYSVIFSENLADFVGKCTEHLNSGWECTGGLQVKDKEYLQAFIKGSATEVVIKKPAPRAKKAVRPKATGV